MTAVELVQDLFALGSRLPGFGSVISSALSGEQTTVVLKTKSLLEAGLVGDRYREAGFVVHISSNIGTLFLRYLVTVSAPCRKNNDLP